MCIAGSVAQIRFCSRTSVVDWGCVAGPLIHWLWFLDSSGIHDGVWKVHARSFQFSPEACNVGKLVSPVCVSLCPTAEFTVSH